MNNRTDILSLRDALSVLREIPGQLIETNVEVNPEAELSGIYRKVGAGGTVSMINGTIKFFRCYDRVLTEAELAWNRQVDNYRYFGPPVTNVIVATTNPNLHGNEAEGPYEVSGAYTFTAPASLTAKGITYTNDGYTVETWDGSAWANAVSYESSSYPYATSAGMVRLTWKWKPVRGLRTTADYGFNDYSQAGLIWNYDGICNVGAWKSHSTNATTWVNLGSAGVAYNLSRYQMSEGESRRKQPNQQQHIRRVRDVGVHVHWPLQIHLETAFLVHAEPEPPPRRRFDVLRLRHGALRLRRQDGSVLQRHDAFDIGNRLQAVLLCDRA